ncbi:MAG TPA: UDP-N-acetylmuramoyl-L-alanyl-D-glutamate--2,6-diaminopimelate ligase [Nitrospiria bacterium]
MDLNELIRAVPGMLPGDPPAAGPVEIRHLTADSRNVCAGSLFVAIRGQHADGHAFLKKAVEQGAVAVVVDRASRLETGSVGVPVIPVDDPRVALGRLAVEFYGRPSQHLGMIGVTGTNGKTTTAYILRSILQAAGLKVGLIGTVVYDLAGETRVAGHTTPESDVLQGLLARSLERGASYAVMEVSSHALSLNRVEGCEFDAAVFTNLSQDHLDFHKTLEAYYQAKRRLFEGMSVGAVKERPKRAIINQDDEWGRRLIGEVRIPVWTYGLDEKSDVMAEDLNLTLKGASFTAVTPAGPIPVRSGLVGRHNVYNLLSAIGTAVHLDIPGGAIREGIGRLTGVPGRFERVSAGQAYDVIVDFAHTEAALDRLLRTVKKLAHGRIITVFGCGGDRDPGKRGPMGRTATRYSDIAVVTSDNPRTEDPLEIIRQIEAGVREEASRGKRGIEVLSIPDRREAIGRAIRLASAGDAVVIAGKGHEEYQIIGDRKYPFDDRQVARDWITSTPAAGKSTGAPE